MPGLDPGIHRTEALRSKKMDCRVMPGNDRGWISANGWYCMKWPRIRSRRTTAVSPWVSIIAREVEFSRGAAPQTYHAVEQADSISIGALLLAELHGFLALPRNTPRPARRRRK